MLNTAIWKGYKANTIFECRFVMWCKMTNICWCRSGRFGSNWLYDIEKERSVLWVVQICKLFDVWVWLWVVTLHRLLFYDVRSWVHSACNAMGQWILIQMLQVLCIKSGNQGRVPKKYFFKKIVFLLPSLTPPPLFGKRPNIAVSIYTMSIYPYIKL